LFLGLPSRVVGNTCEHQIIDYFSVFHSREFSQYIQRKEFEWTEVSLAEEIFRGIIRVKYLIKLFKIK